MKIERVGLDEWNSLLPSSGFEVFHTAEALEVVDDHTTGDLRLLVGYKGERAVGLIPVFIRQIPFGTAVTSPPPSKGIPRLGPLLMPASPKQRKQESLNRNFVTAVVDDLGLIGSATVFRSTCPTSYSDPRPFVWSGFDVSTEFSYAIDIEGRSKPALIDSFNPRLSEEIRRGERCEDFDISVGDVEALHSAYGQASADASGQTTPSYPWEYVRDLVTALKAVDRCRIYTATDDSDEVISASVVLFSNDRGYYWQAFPNVEYRGIDVESQFHWAAIKDIVDGVTRESVTKYDLLEANSIDVCHYKSLFGTLHSPNFVAESNGMLMRIARGVYRMKPSLL